MPIANLRIRIRQMTKIFEKFAKKIGECEQAEITNIFVRTKSIACAPRAQLRYKSKNTLQLVNFHLRNCL